MAQYGDELLRTLFTYGNLGRQVDAMNALEQMENRLDARYANQRSELKFERAKLYANSGDYKKAETLIREVTEQLEQMGTASYHLNAQIAKLRADIYVGLGKVNEAYEEIARELEIYKQAVEADQKKYHDAPGTPILLEQLEILTIIRKRTGSALDIITRRRW